MFLWNISLSFFGSTFPALVKSLLFYAPVQMSSLMNSFFSEVNQTFKSDEGELACCVIRNRISL